MDCSQILTRLQTLQGYELDKLLLYILEESQSPKRRFELSTTIYPELVRILPESSICRTLIILKTFYLHSRELALRRTIAVERGVMLAALLGLDDGDLEVKLHYLNLLSIFSADDTVIGDFSRSIDASTRVHVNLYSGLLHLLVQLSSTRTDLGLQGMLSGVSVLNRLISVDLDLADHFSGHIRNQQLLCHLLLSEQTYFVEYQMYLFSVSHKLVLNNPSGLSAQLLESTYQCLHHAAANKRLFSDPAFSAEAAERKEGLILKCIEELSGFFFAIVCLPAVDKSRALLGNCIKANDVVLQFLAQVAGFGWRNQSHAFTAVRRVIKLAACFVQLTLNPLTKVAGGALTYHVAQVYWDGELKTALCDLLEAVDPPNLKAAKGTVGKLLEELSAKRIADEDAKRYGSLIVRIVLWSCGTAGDETPRSSEDEGDRSGTRSHSELSDMANDCIMKLTHRLDETDATPEYKQLLVQVICKLGLHADISAYCMQTIWGFFVTICLNADADAFELANAVARELLKLLRGYLPNSGEILTEVLAAVNGKPVQPIEDIAAEPEYDIPKKSEEQRSIFAEVHVNMEFLHSLGDLFDKTRGIGVAEVSEHAEIISVVFRVLYLCSKARGGALPLPIHPVFVMAAWPVVITNEAGFDVYNGAVAAFVLMKALEHEKTITAELTGSLLSMYSLTWMQRTLEALNAVKKTAAVTSSVRSFSTLGGPPPVVSGGNVTGGFGLWENQLGVQSMFIIHYYRRVFELSFVGADRFKTSPLADRVGLLRLVCGFITRSFVTSTTLETCQTIIRESLTLLLHAADPRRSAQMVDAIRIMRIGEYWPTLIPLITNYADPIVESILLGIFQTFVTSIEQGWFDDSIFITLDAVFKESCLLFLPNECVGLLCRLLDLDALKPAFKKTHQYVLHRLIVNTEKRFYYARAENVSRLRKVALALSAAIKPGEHVGTSYRQSYALAGQAGP